MSGHARERRARLFRSLYLAPEEGFELSGVPARSPENLVRLVAALNEIDARYGHRVCTLGLASLIRSQEAAGRDKDLAVLAILRRTLEESTK